LEYFIVFQRESTPESQTFQTFASTREHEKAMPLVVVNLLEMSMPRLAKRGPDEKGDEKQLLKMPIYS